ncbi:hypothetical protein OBV_29260 [Oscillibacter valericigenes Sjm18-20]|nr:hypothetical protein OBV_29260 [Oscillibacter valericigenes Sjm18-20]
MGTYTEKILYDNMKQVVIKRLLKQEDSTLNRQFEEFAGFYEFRPGFTGHTVARRRARWSARYSSSGTISW